MEDHPDYGRWTVAMVVAGGVVSSPFFVADDALPDFDPGEVGARVAHISFGTTTVNSAQPEMENTVIGPGHKVMPPDPADKFAAFVRSRATGYLDVTSGSSSST